MNYFVRPSCSHSRGEVFSTNLPFPLSRPLTKGNSLYLTSSPLKGEEDFSGEPYLFILGVVTRGGGILLRTYLSHTRDL